MKKISVQELAQIIKSKKEFVLIDVREDYEFELGHIDCIHIPMDDVPTKAQELDCNKETYLLCQSGKRAEVVANFLEVNFGFTNIGFVEGGIAAYANEIDQSIEV